MGAAVGLLQGRPALPPVAKALAAVEALQLLLGHVAANDDLGRRGHRHLHILHTGLHVRPGLVVGLRAADVHLPTAEALLLAVPQVLFKGSGARDALKGGGAHVQMT